MTGRQGAVVPQYANGDIAALHSGLQPSPERLGFIICFATALHLAMILGVSFDMDDIRPRLPSLEVTLAQYQSKSPPDKADYIAQYDQAGSGTLDDKAELSSRRESAYHHNTAPTEEVLKQARRQELRDSKTLLHSNADASRALNVSTARDKRQVERHQGDDDTSELSDNIAALEAQLDRLNQSYANMPRPKFITSVATRGSPDALYLDRWESHIEEIGNRYYPDEARRTGIEGELRLLLMLFPDGRIDEVRIMSSSGNPLLDQAAHRIVRLAAPFEAIPAEVLDGKNRLGIVRTWRFERDALRASGS
ncbi:energy transducer TonB [Spongiibacter sp. KMU-166]|uniref:Energy transducer TonB n=1 Tax=Spongiibacter thalassae TaxID=2721624 RepID=A0ABX1GHS8_9GAMM|nr:energy transducer TonB [Spongiibacter thalassae]NKI18480.1 energy transducer TonB [Spongiibacter thalassae]